MASPTTTRTEELTAALVRFLETGTANPGLFAPDVFCDLVLPDLAAAGRRPGRRRSRCAPTTTRRRAG